MDACALPRIAAAVEYLPNALRIPEGISFDDWEDIGAKLKASLVGHQWWIGDWLRFGGHKWGDKYEAAAAVLGMKPQTLRKYKQIAEAFPEFGMRIPNCSFNHHQIAASLPPKRRARVLQAAAGDGWSAARLRSEIQHAKPRLAAPPVDDDCKTAESLFDLCGMKFGTVYADPPWQYGNQATRASTDDHYGTMTVDDLCLMPVADLAADDAHLHLWTTNGFLPDAFRVISAWGFEYRSCFVWVKPQMGIGNYWRVSHEFLLLGIRGDAKRFNSRSLKSWGEFKRRRHSAKPEQVREMIEQASPGPYLEMFGRSPAPGWTVMGNQIERQLFS